MSSNASHINLRTENLSVGYPMRKKTLVILSEISLKLDTPKLIGIIGKNGAGKSTLLRTLAGLQEVLEGKIFLEDVEISKISSNHWAKNVAVVLTELPSDSIFTAYEIIAMGRQVYTNWLDKLTLVDEQIIENAIKITNVEKLIHKHFNELSDGQKQKIMITRALAQNTPIIMLDEPTVHLDVNHSMEIFLLFQKLVKEHQKTILLTTHEISLSTQLCDELWLIDQNKMLIDSTENILKNHLISKIFDTNIVRFNEKSGNFEYR